MSSAKAALPTRLRVEHLDEPIGLDVRRPRLSWWLPEGLVAQEAYELRIDGVESGRVDSDQHVLVPWPTEAEVDLPDGQHHAVAPGRWRGHWRNP